MAPPTAPVRIGDPDPEWSPRDAEGLTPAQYAEKHEHEAIRALVQVIRHSGDERNVIRASRDLLMYRLRLQDAAATAGEKLPVASVREAALELFANAEMRTQMRKAMRGELEA